MKESNPIENETAIRSSLTELHGKREVSDETIAYLHDVLESCVRAGVAVRAPADRERLQVLARDVADTIFKFTLRYPDAVVLAPPVKVSDQRVSPSRLPHVADKVFGRDEEFARLDAAWSDPKTHVVTLVVWGGVGKTSLVAKWAAKLAGRDYDGADYFDWSFYS